VGVKLVLAGGLLALLVGVVIVLSQSAPRRSGSNGIPAEQFALSLPVDQTVCQGGELVPGDTAAVQATLGTFYKPGPRISLTATVGGRLLTSGGLAQGWTQGPVRIPVRPVHQTTGNVTVCLHNAGPVLIAIGGIAPYATGNVRVIVGHHAVIVPAGLRYDYFRPGTETWWSLLPTLWYRMTLAKGDLVRHWAPWAALALLLTSIGLAVRSLVVEAARS